MLYLQDVAGGGGRVGKVNGMDMHRVVCIDYKLLKPTILFWFGYYILDSIDVDVKKNSEGDKLQSEFGDLDEPELDGWR